jgi:localization factor PodJL
MKPGIPWSVKGIADDARETAKMAARKSGMTLGEWLNNVILEQADTPSQAEGAAHYRASPPQPRPSAAREDVNSKLDNIAAQLARLAGQAQETAAGRLPEQDRDDDADREIITEILARLDRNEQIAAEAFQAIDKRLNAIGTQAMQSSRQAFPDKPEDVPGYQALESALRNIVDHIEVSDKRTRETLKTVQDRMTEIAERPAGGEGEGVLQNAPALARLEDRLTEIVSRLDRAEAATQHALPSLVEYEVTRLSERLDTMPVLIADEVGRLANRIETLPEFVSDEVGKLAGRIEALQQLSEQQAQQVRQARADQVTQQDLDEVESRMQGAFEDTQSAMRSLDPTQEIHRLRGDLGRLDQRIDDLKADAASDSDLQSVKVAMEQLSARVAQGPDLRPLTEMDRRLAEITRKLEQVQTQPRFEPQVNALERRVFDLDQRLAEAMLRQPEPRVIETLDRQVAAVADRIGRTEQQLSQLSTFENSINQLFKSLEQNRTAARDFAEEAATRMAENLLQNHLNQPQSHEPSAELIALEQGLEAVRASANAADQRNQETLEAVHETLEQIVNKLAEMEGAPADIPLRQPHAWQDSTAADVESEAMAYQHAQAPAPAFEARSPAFEARSPAFEARSYARSPVEETAPVETAQTFEPQSEASPEEREEPPKSPPHSTPDQGAVADFNQDDFIAAARRAAQAAARQPPGPVAASMGFLGRAKPTAAKAPRVQSVTSRFSLPFLFKQKRVVPPETEKSGSASTVEGKRRRLLLAGLVLLTAVSAYTVHSLGRSGQLSLSVRNIFTPTSPGNAAKIAIAKTDARKDNVAASHPTVAALSKTGNQSQKSDSLAGDEILTASVPVSEEGTARPRQELQPDEKLPDAIGPASLRMAAAGGDAQAQFIVATRYLEGKSVGQDFAAAARWFERSAAKGLAPAQYRIGTLFERGKGVRQDMAAARLWYERAAEGGNVKAMHNVAVIYAGDQAGGPNYAKAARWFTEAGQHGLKDSQYNLAVLYERGLGVKQDMAEALYWYSLAARQSDVDAARKADSLSLALAASTLATVQGQLKGFSLKQDSPEANMVAVRDPAWQDAPPASVADASSSEMPVLGAVVDMSANPIAQIQGLLNDLGYAVGEPDGKMSTRTSNAIRLFELQAGMKVTGEVTGDLIARLKAKKG